MPNVIAGNHSPPISYNNDSAKLEAGFRLCNDRPQRNFVGCITGEKLVGNGKPIFVTKQPPIWTIGYAYAPYSSLFALARLDHQFQSNSWWHRNKRDLYRVHSSLLRVYVTKAAAPWCAVPERLVRNRHHLGKNSRFQKNRSLFSQSFFLESGG